MPPLNCGPSLQTILDKIYARLNAIQGGAGGGNCDLSPVLLQLDQIESYLAGGLATMIGGVQLSVNSANQSLGTVTTQLGEIQTAISLLSSTGGGTVKAGIVWDEKAIGVNGGTFTAGAWRQRDLNTKLDPDGLVTVASNAFTIVTAGRYYLRATAPFTGVEYATARLTKNNTQIALSNISVMGALSAQTNNLVAYVGDLVAGDVIRVEHRSSATYATYGFGAALNNSWANNIYTLVEIIKLD